MFISVKISILMNSFYFKIPALYKNITNFLIKITFLVEEPFAAFLTEGPERSLHSLPTRSIKAAVVSSMFC